MWLSKFDCLKVLTWTLPPESYASVSSVTSTLSNHWQGWGLRGGGGGTMAGKVGKGEDGTYYLDAIHIVI